MHWGSLCGGIGNDIWMPVWFALGSLSLGFPSAVLRVLVPLKCTWIPFLLHSFLNFSLALGM